MARAHSVVKFGLALSVVGSVTLHAGGVLETIDITHAVASPIPGQILASVIGIKWDTRSIPVQYRVNASTGVNVPNPLGDPVLTLADGTATLQQAFDTWNEVPTSFIEMNIVGAVEDRRAAGFDFVNEVTFLTPGNFAGIASSPSVALIADSTFADGDDIDEDGDSDVSAGISVMADVDGDGDLEFPAGFYKAGTILDNDVQFNTKGFNAPHGAEGFRFTAGDESLDSDARSVDLLAVAVHEFGHSFGLSHSPDNQTSASDGGGSTMFPFIDTTDPEAERQQRSLHTDDIAWSSYLYPEGSSSAGPGRLRGDDVAFNRRFGLITGDVRHGVLNQPIAGASVRAIDESGRLYASGFSGTSRLSVDPVSGDLFVPPAASDAIVDGRYVIPVAPGRYAVAIEPIDGHPVPAASISFTAQIGAFFGQQDFHEEFYNRLREQDAEVRPGQAATVRAYRGAITPGIDIVTNRTFATPDFLFTALGFADAPPGAYYALRVPGSAVAGLNADGSLIPHSIIFQTFTDNASVAPVFAEAVLTTGTVNGDGTATLDLSNPLDRMSPFVGQDDDAATMFLKNPRELGRRIRRGLERGEIDSLFLVLRLPDGRFPGVSGVPPLVGLDTLDTAQRSFVSTDGGVTFSAVTGANFAFSLAFAAPHEDGSPAPVAEDGAIATAEDTAVSGFLTAHDPGAGALSFDVSLLPRHGAVVITNRSSGTFTYTPDRDFSGADFFLFRVTNDKYSSNSGVVTVTVTPVNDAPVARNRRIATAVDTPVIGTLVATDVDDNPLFFSVESPPTNGAVAIIDATAGTFVYTPGSGFIGTDGFTFRASDGALSSDAGTITIQVGAPEEYAPLNSVVVVTQEGAAVNGTLGPSSPGGNVSFTIERQPAMGVLTLTDPASGDFTFAPNAGAVGFDTFTFAADAGSGPLTGRGLVFIVSATPPLPGRIERVSVSTAGVNGNDDSGSAAVSADGRYVAFESWASNLVESDTNRTIDVFVRDRTAAETARVSIADDGKQADSGSTDAALSADARYVAFASGASSLVPDDTNGVADIFVHDRLTGATTRVNVASDGSQANPGFNGDVALSTDGRFVAFTSSASNLVANDTNGWVDVFLHDRATHETIRVNVASDGSQTRDGNSAAVRVSSDGRYVSFTSPASNLVAGDTNRASDAFIHDRITGETIRVSVDSAGVEGNADTYSSIVSADGRFVVFSSAASNLVADDTNEEIDLFVHDRTTGQTTRVNVASDGTQALDGSIFSEAVSADGRYIAFTSSASTLVPNDTNGVADVFVHDRMTGETRRLTGFTSAAGVDAMSADGRYVVFSSSAGSPAPGQQDVFIVGGIPGP